MAKLRFYHGTMASAKSLRLLTKKKQQFCLIVIGMHQ